MVSNSTTGTYTSVIIAQSERFVNAIRALKRRGKGRKLSRVRFSDKKIIDKIAAQVYTERKTYEEI